MKKNRLLSAVGQKFPASLASNMRPHGKVSFRGVRSVDLSNTSDLVMVSTVFGKINSREIEAARRSIRRSISKAGKLLVLAYPHLPLTKKPLQVRMGKGKGSKVKDWVCPVKPGQPLFKLSVRNPAAFAHLFYKGSFKLSIPVRVLNSGVSFLNFIFVQHGFEEYVC